MKRLGLLGGTFDPPHHGHVRLAQAALAQLQLDQVLWLVTADPPHKQGNPISPVTQRVALVNAAIAGEPAFQLSRIDVDRPGPHWSADTVRLLSAQFLGVALVFLLGGDSLRDLPKWQRPRELLHYCTLGVLRRPGDAIDLPALEAQLPGLSAKVEFIEAPPLDIASNELRRRLQAGEDVADFMPAAVWQLIQQEGWYRNG